MKRSDIPVEKATINLFKGDFEKLRGHFPRQGGGFIIRNLVRQFLRKIEEDAAQKVDSADITLNLKEME